MSTENHKPETAIKFIKEKAGVIRVKLSKPLDEILDEDFLDGIEKIIKDFREEYFKRKHKKFHKL